MFFPKSLLLFSLSFFCSMAIAVGQIKTSLPEVSYSNSFVTISALQPGQVVEISGGLRQVVAANSSSVAFENTQPGRHIFTIYPGENGRSSVTPLVYDLDKTHFSFYIPTFEENAPLLHEPAFVPLATSQNLLATERPLSSGLLDGSDYLKSDENCFGCYIVRKDKKSKKYVAEIHPALGTGTIYKNLVSVTPNTWYVFSAEAKAVVEKGRELVSPLAGLLINNADAIDPVFLGETSRKFSAMWYSGNENFVTLELRNQLASPTANPILLEGISLTTCAAPASIPVPGVFTARFKKK